MFQQGAVQDSLTANLALAAAFVRIDEDPRFSKPDLLCNHGDDHEDGYDDYEDHEDTDWS